MSENKTGSAGIGFFGALTIVFIVLKLLHVIEWSWLWVLAPAWIPAAFGAFILLMILIMGATKGLKK